MTPLPRDGARSDAPARGGRGRAAGRPPAVRGNTPQAIQANTVTITVLALVTASVIGGLLSAFTNPPCSRVGRLLLRPRQRDREGLGRRDRHLRGAVRRSVFNPHTVASLFQQASFSTAIHDGYLSAVFNPLSETAVRRRR